MMNMGWISSARIFSIPASAKYCKTTARSWFAAIRASKAELISKAPLIAIKVATINTTTINTDPGSLRVLFRLFINVIFLTLDTIIY
jgi:hypothetical protein